MKKISILFFIAMLVMLAGCSISINFGNDDNQTVTTDVNPQNQSEHGDQPSTTETGKEKQSGKKRMSQDGVDYLIVDGELKISGNGTVTREAIASLSHQYNVVDFEIGSITLNIILSSLALSIRAASTSSSGTCMKA